MRSIFALLFVLQLQFIFLCFCTNNKRYRRVGHQHPLMGWFARNIRVIKSLCGRRFIIFFFSISFNYHIIINWNSCVVNDFGVTYPSNCHKHTQICFVWISIKNLGLNTTDILILGSSVGLIVSVVTYKL